MNDRRTRIDWEAAKARLAESARRLEDSAQLNADHTRRVFESRAQRLAQRSRFSHAQTPHVTLLRVRVSDERYAIEVSRLSGIIPFRGCVQVPGSDESLVGVMSLRGEVHAVIDTQRLLRTQTHQTPATENVDGYVVLLRHAAEPLALYITEVEAIEAIDPDALQRPESDQVLPCADCVKALTPDGAAVLDIDAIVARMAFSGDESDESPDRQTNSEWTDAA